MHHRILHIKKELRPLQKRLENHPLYQELTTLEDVTIFMENHVFAVWDFMSLLKALQNRLTCTEVPWLPYKNPIVARFVNEIVYAEETDTDILGKPKSHFEMYMEAMAEIGADTTNIKQFIKQLQQGKTVAECLNAKEIPTAVKDFVNFSFQVIATDKTHKIASAFTFGREDILPDIFLKILKKETTSNSKKTSDKFCYYLERHIELDGDEHGPLSLQMIDELCGENTQKWAEVLSVAQRALERRIFLWDATTTEIKNNKRK